MPIGYRRDKRIGWTTEQLLTAKAIKTRNMGARNVVPKRLFKINQFVPHM